MALTACTSTLPEWHGEPDHLSLFVGNTSDDGEDSVTIGIDYERRVSDVIGLGTVVEYAGQDIDALTLLGVADIHIWEGFAIQTGPGIEFIDDDGVFVFRVGALYEFEFGDGFTLSPQVHADFTSRSDAIVAGLAFGRAL